MVGNPEAGLQSRLPEVASTMNSPMASETELLSDIE